ncbi:hypothetical protein DPMN_163637 [Dreissena polymorpha]|uniref:Orange domain-containing protein n=1 Tax=Dreissena polymorpha TaxID=45954 RepID=A0A9D4EW63_DREPO|nr:hypothetical protein DPMN_163637 [Dreissena polymorpha]
MTRVDKADILDLTVLHLEHIQQRHRSVYKTTESTAYISGFQACANEVMTYLTAQKSTDLKKFSALNDHLQMALNVLQRCVRNQMPGEHNMSTPVRANDVSKMSLYALNTPGLSPITNPNVLPRGYCKAWTVPLNNSGVAFSSHESSIDSCYSSLNVSSLESDVKPESEDIVYIGHNDKIGHGIKETVWRPF